MDALVNSICDSPTALEEESHAEASLEAEENNAATDNLRVICHSRL